MAIEGEDEKKAALQRKRRIGGGVTLVLLLGVFAYWNRDCMGTPFTVPIDEEEGKVFIADHRHPSDDPRAPPEVTAILGGLKVGSMVAGWRIAALTISTKPEVKDSLTVLFKRGNKSFAIWIVRKGKFEMPAPYETEAYAVYSGLLWETDIIEAGTPIEELLAVIRYNEGAAPPAPSAPPPPSP